jgi:hypothetical protein
MRGAGVSEETESAWQSSWTPTQCARNGSVEIAYDRLVGSDGEPLLLVMGLAVSRFWWPVGLCRAFADRRAVNPDAGQRHEQSVPGRRP